MNGTDVALMMEYLKAFEPYLAIDEIQVAAWSESLLPTMDAQWARACIAKHYSDTDAPRMSPGILNRGWRMYSTNQSVEGNNGDNACGRSICRCTHTECDRGFVNSVEVYGAVAPCPQCKPETFAVLQEIPQLGSRKQWQFSHVSEAHRRKKEGNL
jgi:hypothetical protein